MLRLPGSSNLSISLWVEHKCSTRDTVDDVHLHTNSNYFPRNLLFSESKRKSVQYIVE
jgi:hypothetical protein